MTLRATGGVEIVALRGRVVTDHEVLAQGTVLIEGGQVADVSREPLVAHEVHEYPDHLLLPGFVDLQINGAFGIDIATEPRRVPELSKKLVATGTTSFLPTMISSPKKHYRETLPTLAELTKAGAPDGAEPLGIHLEGPFIDIEKRGAHPAEYVCRPDAGLLNELLDLGSIRLLTLAPELAGAQRLVETARRRNVVVSAGHSAALFEEAYRAFDGGVAGVTHLFNAMSPLHHREPGLPGAAFAHQLSVCSIIADGRHVHPEAVSLAFRLLGPDRLCLVTDAVAATGMGSGEYPLATRRVYLDDGDVPRLGDGTLAGSVLTMDEALRNVLAFTGCTVPEAARMAATTPAKLIGEHRKGRLAPGYDADVTVLDPGLSVEAVYKGGIKIYAASG